MSLCCRPISQPIPLAAVPGLLNMPVPGGETRADGFFSGVYPGITATVGDVAGGVWRQIKGYAMAGREAVAQKIYDLVPLTHLPYAESAVMVGTALFLALDTPAIGGGALHAMLPPLVRGIAESVRESLMDDLKLLASKIDCGLPDEEQGPTAEDLRTAAGYLGKGDTLRARAYVDRVLIRDDLLLSRVNFERGDFEKSVDCRAKLSSVREKMPIDARAGLETFLDSQWYLLIDFPKEGLSVDGLGDVRYMQKNHAETSNAFVQHPNRENLASLIRFLEASIDMIVLLKEELQKLGRPAYFTSMLETVSAIALEKARSHPTKMPGEEAGPTEEDISSIDADVAGCLNMISQDLFTKTAKKISASIAQIPELFRKGDFKAIEFRLSTAARTAGSESADNLQAALEELLRKVRRYRK